MPGPISIANAMGMASPVAVRGTQLVLKDPIAQEVNVGSEIHGTFVGKVVGRRLDKDTVTLRIQEVRVRSIKDQRDPPIIVENVVQMGW